MRGVHCMRGVQCMGCVKGMVSVRGVSEVTTGESFFNSGASYVIEGATPMSELPPKPPVTPRPAST